MQPAYHPLANIFGTQTRHLVPLFQRPYVWSREEQWEPLWDDLSHLADRLVTADGRKVAGHFLGTVRDAGGQPIADDGTWGIAFGNGVIGTPEQLIVAVGADEYEHGLVKLVSPVSG